MIKRLLLFLVLCIAAPAQAAPLVADLSNYSIAMDANFSGTRLFLFGARSEPGDIVVVVRGPARNYMVRKKEEIAGIWVNRDHMKFYHVPDFYALAASKPLSEIDRGNLLSQLAIGTNYLLHAPSNEFEEAFLNYQVSRKLYTDIKEPIGFVGETLFKTVIEFPDNIPPGNYTAEIYLISDGELTGMQATPITVDKSGLDAAIYNFAHGSPGIYGLSCILLAVAAGWVASRIFEIRA